MGAWGCDYNDDLVHLNRKLGLYRPAPPGLELLPQRWVRLARLGRRGRTRGWALAARRGGATTYFGLGAVIVGLFRVVFLRLRAPHHAPLLLVLCTQLTSHLRAPVGLSAPRHRGSNFDPPASALCGTTLKRSLSPV